MKKKSFVLIMIFCLSMLLGCSKNEVKIEENQSVEKTEKKVKTVIDQVGDEVEIPENIERVVITFQPFGSIYPLFVESADTIVGMLPGSMFAAENSLLKSAYPEILNVDTSFYQDGDVNIESVMNLKPDIVLYMAGSEKEREMYKNAGIPALGFDILSEDFDTVETYNGWVDILGKTFDMEEKANKIIDYNNKAYDEINDRLSTLSEEDKVRILLLNNYSPERMGTSGGKQFPDFWCRGSGGLNVASGEFTGNKQINMEQVYEWNPDIIYVSTFSPYSAEEILTSNAKQGDDWSNIKAIKDGRVHKFPLGMFRWYPPNSESILSLWWMSKTNYPELFEDVVIEDKIREYYDMFYNYQPTDEEIEEIFNPASEASGVGK